MNIIIDVTRLVRRLAKKRMLTGIDRVSMAYVQHYEDTARALVRWSGRSWVLSSSQSKALFLWLVTPGSQLALMRIIVMGILSNRALNNNKDTFLLNTGHIGLGQSDYLRMVRTRQVKPIFFVHDLIPISYPEYSNPGEDIRYKEKMNYILALASGVITNSEATHQDLVQYAQQTNQSMRPAQVALLAPGVVFAAPGPRPIDKPYFVILSTIEPRKNHLLLLQIWRSLVQRLGDETPHLVVIGQRGWECENVLDLLDRSQFLKGVVTEISHCQDSDLVTYIRHSQALLMPSFIEGYGLPLIEALTMGTPVIASDIPVFREVAGDVAEYADPLDGKRWEELILDYAKSDSVHRAAQLRRIQTFKQPTWDEHFTKVDSFLLELLEHHQPNH
ncbi:MAG: glycosyltransferase family 1 protein [Legionellaceae bacterium]|nr:glycosyltransferase family 1 protein [Legionellaceae bacterium]